MWFTENPWPPMLLFGVAGVILLRFAQQRLQKKYLIAGMLMLLLAGGTWVAEQAIVTPRERIQASITDMVTQFQQRNIDATLKHISARSETLQNRVVQADQQVSLSNDMRVTDILVDFTGQQTRAAAKFRVNGTVTMRSNSYSQRTPTRWESKWQLENGEWKMFEIRYIDPITGEGDSRFD